MILYVDDMSILLCFISSHVVSLFSSSEATLMRLRAESSDTLNIQHPPNPSHAYQNTFADTLYGQLYVATRLPWYEKQGLQAGLCEHMFSLLSNVRPSQQSCRLL
ncbi:hypothetical protein LIER_18740 [Lithospermum erythrorhizon]|uniref:Uncharacterized protein n=1 Tax=Lithospermum erythrorhizon TaxID=34254 RepID=A0AAV3QHX2_LITER